MKVCHISSVHDSDDIRIFKKQCVSLANIGVDVTYLVQEINDSKREGVKIKALKKRRGALSRIFFTLPEIIIFAFRNDFDIYHAHDPELIPVLFFLKLCGKNVIYDMHENFPRQLKTKNVHPWVKSCLNLIWPQVEKFVFKRINVIYAESSYKEDYRYVNSAIDLLNMPLLKELNSIDKTKHKEFSIAYVGGISRERFLDGTLEAIEKLEKKGIKIRFDCIGPVYYEESLQCIEYYKNKLENFNFYGQLPPKKAWEIVAKCHVGIAVLLPLPNYIGSYPTKLFEYLGLKMPVITSNFELYKPIVEGNNVGFCVDPVNQHDFVRALEKLATNPELLNLMSENSKEILEKKYSWDIEFRKLMGFYKAIC
ncbi:glycosyltransferase family 4 protein [Vibrio brasiliensis]|uniref:glycosyltransferase family 4 protein n=1 Tax=Vibrio brasiliensis TaxID=170652 RepID=UPI001EFD0B02|nr:glycosyltransferase family 4 protein [Vibrio brasiliensis]